MTSMHTFAIHAEDRAGILNRVVSLFRRRGFDLHSLAVGPSETAGVVRMTVMVQTDSGGAARLRAQLYKLVHVIRVEDITRRASIARDLALIKVSADHESRYSLMQLVQVFDARVVDVAADSLVVEMTAPASRIDDLLEVLRPYGVMEVARTGGIAMTRGVAAELAVPGAVLEREVEAGVSYSV